jgi:endonuclease/exonuclease/phosphatase (EEP) superfamily protein YafD
MSRALIAALLLVLASCSKPSRKAHAPRPGQPTLRVMTYNVNYGLAGDPSTLEAIAAGEADLVLLQETTRLWQQSLEERFADEYPYRSHHHFRGAGGQAVLSRVPYKVVGQLPARHGWFPALVIHAETDLGTIQVLSVHLRPPISDSGSVVSGYFTTGEIRRAEISDFFGELDSDLPTLVVGDFNESDGDAIAFLRSRGLRSGLAEFAPNADTWRWQTSLGSVHSQLDHVVYSRRLEPLDVRVLQRGRSDHLPVVADFILPDSE